MKSYDVIIIGGGAAGLMCALTAGQRGRRTLVLEGSNKVGKKILMSGGGRCNFTNLYIEPDRYLSANPHFFKSAMSRYTQWDFINLVERHHIAYHEKKPHDITTGQLFCDDSSKAILGMLLEECRQAGVEILTECKTDTIRNNEGFELKTSKGTFRAESLVIASGGLSIPKMGASGFGYEVAQQFGMRILPTRAGLAPLTFTGTFQELSERLSGVSLPARVSTHAKEFIDDILFTHRGLSGPSVLQLSSYWFPGETISIDLLPNTDALQLLKAGKQTQPKAVLRTLLAQHLPRKLVLELEMLWWPQHIETAMAELPDQLLTEIAVHLKNWVLKPSGTEGYRTAEVTLGGVDTRDLSSKTMESRTQPGLYFIGEVVDVTGHLGGFNFQWAWASGYVAGQYV